MSRSTLLLAILAVILFIVGFVGGYYTGQIYYTPTTQTKTAGTVIEVPVGILAALSGAGAVEGSSIANGIIIGLDEVNQFYQSIGAPLRIKYYIEDTKTNPDEALKALQKLYESYGVKIVLGPQFSREVMAVRDYALRNKILILSSYSTSPALAIAGDTVYRNIGNDAYQGKALASLICREGINKIVVIYRNDAYGAGLASTLRDNFMKQCGKAVEMIPYTPDLPDYASEVRTLSDKVASLGADSSTGVVLIAFESDGANILGHASKDPILSRVRWFGSEATRVPEVLFQTPEIASFVLKIDFTGTFPTSVTSVKYNDFLNKYRSRFGKDPFPVAANGYDAAWLIGLTILALNGNVGNIDTFIKTMTEIAKSFYGATGLNAFDETGDRLYQDYSIWRATSEGGKYVIKDIEIYEMATGTFKPIG
ncbi:MAG: ABC transporter substrate-binding protein [Sulfolobales archaeon]